VRVISSAEWILARGIVEERLLVNMKVGLGVENEKNLAKNFFLNFHMFAQ
jgi:hypothetical protein